MKRFFDLSLPLQLGILYILLIAVFFVSLSASFLIPRELVEENILESAKILKAEGLRHFTQFPADNDALQTDTRASYLKVRTALGHHDTRAIVNAMDGYSYARYWHGYVVILRPLFMFGTIILVRYLEMFILGILLCLVFSEIHKKIGLCAAVSFLVSLVAVYFYVVPLSTQHAPNFIIMLAACLFLLRHAASLSDKNLAVFFFLIGMFTNFFDLLTTPLLTVGMPAAVLFSLELQAPQFGRSAPSVKRLIRFVFYWGVGYALCWAAKWVLATVVLKENIIADAISQAVYRTVGGANSEGGPQTDTNPFHVILQNLRQLVPDEPPSVTAKSVYILAGTAFTAYVGYLWISRRKGGYRRVAFSQLAPFLLLAVSPFVWYSVLANHSGLHDWFTYRIMALTIFSLLLFLFFGIHGAAKSGGKTGLDAVDSPLQTEKKPI